MCGSSHAIEQATRGSETDEYFVLGSVTLSNSTIVVRVRAIAMATPAAYAIPSAATPPARRTSRPSPRRSRTRAPRWRLAIQSARSRVICLASGLSGPGSLAVSACFSACPRLPATSGPWSERTASPTIGRTIHNVLRVHNWRVMYAPLLVTNDRYRERLLDPARKLTPRGSVRERLRPAELKQTNRLDHTGANADEQRQACVGGPVRCTRKLKTTSSSATRPTLRPSDLPYTRTTGRLASVRAGRTD